MKITQMRTCHLENPVGCALDPPVLSWAVEESTATRQVRARVQVATDDAFATVVYDSGEARDISALAFVPGMPLSARTRYFWRVSVWADDGDAATSPTAFFETGRLDLGWQAQWLAAPFPKSIHPLMRKGFELPSAPVWARAYVCGLGLYELEVNGQRVGDEVLTPFCNDYGSWLQYQTYDVTALLQPGANAVGAMLGNGWYKGRFGTDDNAELYGNKFLFLCQLDMVLEDGTPLTVATDGSWMCHAGPVQESSIYDGEVYDARAEVTGWSHPGCDEARFRPAIPLAGPTAPLSERLSPPLRIIETLPPPAIILTPAGETVLDYGQEITGWVEFSCDLPAGAAVTLTHGEILQEGNFYTDNLRTAKQRYTYISSGAPVRVRPHFTFYGFRYVKVEGIENPSPADFTACVIHSHLAFTGRVETSDEKLNRLAANALWGQRGNFVDVPTDCPQRDERWGWTGDAQVFAPTASFFMHTPAFYHKYLTDLAFEQGKRLGAVPYVVPDVLGQGMRHNGEAVPPTEQAASCAWGDAATIIPWTLYQFYGDATLLAKHFPAMAAWVDFIKRQDDTEGGGSRLWCTGFHFADWLALDNPDKESRFGGTDPFYVASAYYYYSASLTAAAAGVLGYEEEARRYGQLAGEVLEAIRAKYFATDGQLFVDTQTALALALHFGLARPEHRPRLAADLARKLDENGGCLTTGFVGTPCLCPALTDNGYADHAWALLLNEDYPGWLYEVNMGATTVWERWNSVLPDGRVSDTGMNSLNHYAYGAVMEWVFRAVCGLNPETPGFKTAVIAPVPSRRLSWARAVYHAAAGTYRSGWRCTDTGVEYDIEVPFDAEARFVLPALPTAASLNGMPSTELTATGQVVLPAGRWQIVAED